MSDRPTDDVALLLNRILGAIGLQFSDEWLVLSFAPYCEGYPIIGGKPSKWGYMLTLCRPGEPELYEVKVLPR